MADERWVILFPRRGGPARQERAEEGVGALAALQTADRGWLLDKAEIEAGEYEGQAPAAEAISAAEHHAAKVSAGGKARREGNLGRSEDEGESARIRAQGEGPVRAAASAKAGRGAPVEAERGRGAGSAEGGLASHAARRHGAGERGASGSVKAGDKRAQSVGNGDLEEPRKVRAHREELATTHHGGERIRAAARGKRRGAQDEADLAAGLDAIELLR